MSETLSIPIDAGVECNELTAMSRRIAKTGKPDYSVGHKRMYLAAIELLKGNPCTVLEVGFGIGYGLELMLKAMSLSRYVGVEPCQDSFKYVNDQITTGDLLKFAKTITTVELIQQHWSEANVEPADYSFCIEVIEHVPEAALPLFLWKLRQKTLKNLFLSTPDSTRSKHGVKTQAEWIEMLRRHGFNAVAVSHQWTTLFVCS